MAAKTLTRAAIGLLGTIAIPAMVAAQETPLTIGMSTTPTTLDPHEDSSAPNNATSRHIWDSLINLTGTSANAPELATEWKVVDPTHWEFKLRKGVKFHDGSEFNADDVIASLLRARDKPSQSFASYTRNIVNVTATDPYTIVVETKVPDPILLNSVSRIRIISADCKEAPVQDFDNGKCAIGTGAYSFVSYSPGSNLTLKRNDSYFAGPSHWSNVTLRFLPDDGARLASLLPTRSTLSKPFLPMEWHAWKRAIICKSSTACLPASSILASMSAAMFHLS